MEPGRFAVNHGLLLLDVVVNGTVRIHLFNLLHPLDGGLDGVEIGHRAAQPAFGDIKLAAFLGGFLDALLRLLLGADKQDFPAPANRRRQKLARGFELHDRLAQVDDMDAIARVEDERLHLGIPTLGLMSEMDAAFQQFFYADADHFFPLVKTLASALRTPQHPAEHGIVLDVVRVRPRTVRRVRPHPLDANRTVSPPADSSERVAKAIRKTPHGNSFFWTRFWNSSGPCALSRPAGFVFPSGLTAGWQPVRISGRCQHSSVGRAGHS